jgi:hypothetical protein
VLVPGVEGKTVGRKMIGAEKYFPISFCPHVAAKTASMSFWRTLASNEAKSCSSASEGIKNNPEYLKHQASRSENAGRQ